MPKPFPDPSFNSSVGLFEHANSLTNNWYAILILMAGFLVIFITAKTKNYRTSDSMLVSSFLMWIFSTFFWAAALIQAKIMIIFFIFTLASAIYCVLDK